MVSSAGQLLIVDFVAITDDAAVVRAVDVDAIVDLDDHPIVVELTDDFHVVAAFTTLPPEPLTVLAGVAHLDALAFLAFSSNSDLYQKLVIQEQKVDVLDGGIAGRPVEIVS